jgi:hypothetical protein
LARFALSQRERSVESRRTFGEVSGSPPSASAAEGGQRLLHGALDGLTHPAPEGVGITGTSSTTAATVRSATDGNTDHMAARTASGSGVHTVRPSSTAIRPFSLLTV